MLVHRSKRIQRSILILLAWNTYIDATTRSKRGDGSIGSQLNVVKMVEEIDVNKDDVIAVSEFRNFLEQYDNNTDSMVSRCEWVRRNVDDFDDSKLSSLANFDIYDVNGDNLITEDDFDLKKYDTDNNNVVTASELRARIENETTVAKQSSTYNTLKRLSSFNPSNIKIKSTLNIDLIKKDADNDTDGAITRPELQQHFISSFDKNGDFKVTRCEFVTRSVERYGDRKEVAIVAFDNMDSNKNNFIDIDDIKLAKFDQNADGKLTSDEFETAIKKADWAALKKVYPQATTPAPPGTVNGAGVIMPSLTLLLIVTIM